jgi:hypothetical protein
VALTEALDVIDTLIKGEQHLRSLGPEYLLRIGAFMLMCAAAATTRNPRFHMLFAFGGIAYEISYFGRYYGTLDWSEVGAGGQVPAAARTASTELSPDQDGIRADLGSGFGCPPRIE